MVDAQLGRILRHVLVNTDDCDAPPLEESSRMVASIASQADAGQHLAPSHYRKCQMPASINLGFQSSN